MSSLLIYRDLCSPPEEEEEVKVDSRMYVRVLTKAHQYLQVRCQGLELCLIYVAKIRLSIKLGPLRKT